VGLGLLGVLALPLVTAWLEATLLRHLLVQIPLLAVSGCLLASALGRRWSRRLGDYNAGGIPGLIVATSAVAFWMLPRSLDAALADPFMELAKFVSVPLLIGVPLASSWPKLHAIAKGFIWANLISMLVVLGWLYLAAPARLCSYYLLGEQQVLGWALLMLAAAVAVCRASEAFIGRPGGSKDADRQGLAAEPRGELPDV